MNSLGPTSCLRKLAGMATAMLLAACSDMMVERAAPNLEKGSVDRSAVKVDSLDIDPIMRGTVASETGLVGFDPVVVRGYGIVVGLRETGSRQMPSDVRAFLTQELAKRGFGSGQPGAPKLSPQDLLNSGDTAVVIVEGVIPPGAPKGSKFDVRVTTAPGTSTTSLEGGRLLIADLRPGPLFTGSRQPFPLAEGAGPVVINPFVEPNATQRDSINRTSGRVLDGGHVNKDMPLKLRLMTPSHSRAETIQNTINTLFPREPRQKEETAHGRSAETIDLTVPPSFRKRTGEFAELIRHTPLNVENPEQTAMAIRRSLLANPGAAGAAAWRWQALGKRALPMIQDLYEYPEEQPRFAALNAGSKLDDQLAVPPLLELARKSDSLTIRTEAIKLLGRIGTNAEIELGLRELLDDPDVEIRLSAFEALDKRRDPHIIAMEMGRKFVLNIVPSKHRMIYVAQSGQPRVVVFGEGLSVKVPMTLYTWNGRLIVKADEGDKFLEVFYRERADLPATVDRVKPDLGSLIGYFARRPTPDRPETGLNFSYSESISALHELWRMKYIDCDFRAEQDRILAEVLRDDRHEKDLRPEFRPDGDTPNEEEAPKSLSEVGTSRTSGLEGASVGSGLDAAKPRRDTVPR
ncbi:MAG: flagellar basal body P-ring protein FlgI [Planctomycetota bacterium]